MIAPSLRPFWRYYGGKWRAAPRYPAPRPDDTIVEPFAGAAGYSLRYADRRVILIERYAVIADLWRYLIGVTPAEIRRIPCVDAVDDLPSWVPEGGRSLVGFCMSDAVGSPRKTISAGVRRHRAGTCGRPASTIHGWGEAMRERVASQVGAIRHWTIIEGDYTDAPDIEAVWFVDPPYNNRAGRSYMHHAIDYPALGSWCRTRRGPTIVCENEGATWLPFEPFYGVTTRMNGAKDKGGRKSVEAVWGHSWCLLDDTKGTDA